MMSHILLNAELLKETIEFAKINWKLVNNAAFGKSMETIPGYMEVKLVTTQKKPKKMIANSRFKECRIFIKLLVTISMAKETVELNKPIYIGFNALDLSKQLMYKFHHNYLLQGYCPDKCESLFIDTDSLCYQVRTGDVYGDMLDDSAEFDTSDCDVNNFLYTSVNRRCQVR